MPIEPANLVFLAGLVVYVAIRNVYIRRTAGNEKIVRRVDGPERVSMALVFIGNLLLPIVYLLTPFLAFADYRLHAFAPWCGAAVMVMALWLFWRSHADLDLNWSITLEVRRGHELVDHGVYRRVRHPMYAAIFLFGVAQGLLLANWLAGWAAIPTFAVMYFVRAPREEKMMSEQFGDAYRDYVRRTGRLVPLFTRKTP